MSPLQIVRFAAHQGSAPLVEEEIRHIFQAVSASAPKRIQYLAARSGHEFLLALNLADPSVNPLLHIETATRFRSALPNCTSDDPTPPAIHRCRELQHAQL